MSKITQKEIGIKALTIGDKRDINLRYKSCWPKLGH